MLAFICFCTPFYIQSCYYLCFEQTMHSRNPSTSTRSTTKIPTRLSERTFYSEIIRSHPSIEKYCLYNPRLAAHHAFSSPFHIFPSSIMYTLFLSPYHSRPPAIAYLFSSRSSMPVHHNPIRNLRPHHCLFQRLQNILLQVLAVFDPATDSNQIIPNTCGLALLSRNSRMRH